jgi:hypothetical protein
VGAWVAEVALPLFSRAYVSPALRRDPQGHAGFLGNCGLALLEKRCAVTVDHEMAEVVVKAARAGGGVGKFAVGFRCLAK